MVIFRLSFLVALAVGVAPAFAEQTFGEICTGSETIQVGSQSPKMAPYELRFSADLSKREYCYDACGKEQSFMISDAGAAPIKLADIDVPGQTRRLTFDPLTSTVTDFQVYNAGIAIVTRHASGTCKVAEFREPWPLTIAPH